MILKRLKLFATIQMGNGLTLTVPDNYVPEPGSGYTFPLADNAQTGLVQSNSNTGLVKASGGGQQLAPPDYTNKQNGTNARVDPKPSANTNTAPAATNASTNGAKSVSVISGTQPVAPLKNANPKVTFDPNNVKLDKDAFNNDRIERLTEQNSQLQSQLDAANKAKVESAARGRVAGRKQVGVWQGLKNTWNKAGTMKKIGMGGAALAGTYFLGKGLLGGNNNNDQ